MQSHPLVPAVDLLLAPVPPSHLDRLVLSLLLHLPPLRLHRRLLVNTPHQPRLPLHLLLPPHSPAMAMAPVPPVQDPLHLLRARARALRLLPSPASQHAHAAASQPCQVPPVCQAQQEPGPLFHLPHLRTATAQGRAPPTVQWCVRGPRNLDFATRARWCGKRSQRERRAPTASLRSVDTTVVLRDRGSTASKGNTLFIMGILAT